MVVDLNYPKVKKYFLLIIFFLLFSSKSFSEKFVLNKIVELEEPWGISFISKSELIISEKNGKIKIVNINSKKILEIEHNLNLLNVGQGGLLDILYKNNSIWVFIF